MIVYDRQGNPHEIPDEQAGAAIASGEFGVPKDQAVPVFSPQGRLSTVKGADLHAALSDGARLASQGDVDKAKLQKEYGGLGGEAAAAGLEGLSTATLGLSDVAGAAIGGEKYKETREKYRQANPNSTIGGGIGGAIIPSLLTGGAAAPEEAALLGGGKLLAEGAEAAEAGGGLLSGAGAVAKGAGQALAAPARLASGAGGLVERGIAGALGVGEESTSLATALAKRMIAKGAGAATETALISVGQQLGEEALGDPDANGEKLLAALGHGALLGFAGGAGLTAAGELGSAILGRVAPKLSGLAEEQAFRAINPRKAFASEAERIPGGARGIGRRLLDEGVIGAGEDLEQIAPKVSAAKEKAGQEVGKVLDAADEAGFAGPKVADIRARVEKEVLPDLEKLGGTNAGAIGKVRTLLEDVERFAGIPTEEEAAAQGLDRGVMHDSARLTFKQAQDFRARLDDTIKWSTNPLAPVNEGTEATKKVRGIIEGELEQAGEKAAKELGGSFLEKYKEAKLAYRQLTVADKAAQDSLLRVQANNIASPSTKGIGIATLAGSLAHGASGPMGLATGLASAVGHHLVQHRGLSAAAVLLDKLSALRGVESAARSVDTDIQRGVSGFFGEKRAPIRVAKLGGENPYRQHTEAVLRAKQAGEHHAAAVADAAAPLAAHAPRIAKAFQGAATRATSYLAGKVPKTLGGKPSVTPQFDKPATSPVDEANYNRIAQAVHDPMSVLKDLSERRATRAQIDALRDNFPAIYKQVVESFQERLADLKHPLDYAQKLQIGLLLGQPADPTQEPAFVSSMQQTFAEEKSQQQRASQKPASAPKRPITSPAKNTALTTGLTV